MEKIFGFQREVNQELFYEVLREVYEYVEDNFKSENDTFYMQMYNWENEEDETPNFYHKPSGFKLWWYKYPMRSAKCNMKITHEQFLEILYDCRNSLKRYAIHEIKKWWEKERNNDKST